MVLSRRCEQAHLRQNQMTEEVTGIGENSGDRTENHFLPRGGGGGDHLRFDIDLLVKKDALMRGANPSGYYGEKIT